jgi:hypothetical protein
VTLLDAEDVEEWSIVIQAKMAANKKMWQADQDKLVADLALVNAGDLSHSIMTLIILEKKSHQLKEFIACWTHCASAQGLFLLHWSISVVG